MEAPPEPRIAPHRRARTTRPPRSSLADVESTHPNFNRRRAPYNDAHDYEVSSRSARSLSSTRRASSRTSSSRSGTPARLHRHPSEPIGTYVRFQLAFQASASARQVTVPRRLVEVEDEPRPCRRRSRTPLRTSAAFYAALVNNFSRRCRASVRRATPEKTAPSHGVLIRPAQK